MLGKHVELGTSVRLLAGFMVAAFADSPYDVSDAWFSDGGSQISGDSHVFGFACQRRFSFLGPMEFVSDMVGSS